MARRGAPATLPKELESIAQQVGRALEPIGADPASCEFDRERYAIQSAADSRHGRGVGVGQAGRVAAGESALHEQLHCGRGEGFGRSQVFSGGRIIQRRQKVDMLALHAQRLAAGREDVHLRRLAIEALRQRGRRVDDMLAVVEDQQKPAPRQKGQETGKRILRLSERRPAQRRRRWGQASRR